MDSRPQEQKIHTKVGPLELAVMQKLWDEGPALVREMRDKVNPVMAITTMLTTLVRLHLKGLANRELFKHGHRYSAAVSREEWELAFTIETVKFMPSGLAVSCLRVFVDAGDGRWCDLVEFEINRWKIATGRVALA